MLSFLFSFRLILIVFTLLILLHYTLVTTKEQAHPVVGVP